MSGERPALPVVQGLCRPATRAGGLIFTAGMTPRREGVLLFTGPVLVADPPERWRDAVELAIANALAAAASQLDEGERIAAILHTCRSSSPLRQVSLPILD